MAKKATITRKQQARNKAAASKRYGTVLQADLGKVADAFETYVEDIRRMLKRLEALGIESFDMDGVMKGEQSSQALAEWIAYAEAGIAKTHSTSRLETSFLNGDTDK